MIRDPARRIVGALIPLLLVLMVASGGCSWNPLTPADDEVERSEWAFEITGINALNANAYWGQDVTIGVVDTGVDITHPDLVALKVDGWADLVNGKTSPYDDNGHGTHIVGILGANGDILGAVPSASFIIVKAIAGDGSGSDADVGAGIRHCADAGADIIVLSLGGDQRFFDIGDQSAQACQYAIDSGVVVVAAAGNDGANDDGDVSSPAHVEGVIAVGAIDAEKAIAPFSSRGDNEGRWDLPPPLPDPDDTEDPHKKPEVVAPGVEIVSTYIEGGYAGASGTSQAVAFVGGGIALALASNPSAIGTSASAVQSLKSALMRTAEKCPKQGSPHDDRYGYGLVDAAALAEAL